MPVPTPVTLTRPILDDLAASDAANFTQDVVNALNSLVGVAKNSDAVFTNAVKTELAKVSPVLNDNQKAAIATAALNKIKAAAAAPPSATSLTLTQPVLDKLKDSDTANFSDAVLAALAPLVGQKETNEAAFKAAAKVELAKMPTPPAADQQTTIADKLVTAIKASAGKAEAATTLTLTQAMLDKLKGSDAENFTDAVLAKLAALVGKAKADEAAFKADVTAALASVTPALAAPQQTIITNKLLAEVKAAPVEAAKEEKPAAAQPAAAAPSKTATMMSASIDASYSRKWGFEMTASSKVTAKIVAVPAPKAFLDALEDARAGLQKLEPSKASEKPKEPEKTDG